MLRWALFRLEGQRLMVQARVATVEMVPLEQPVLFFPPFQAAG